MWPAQGNRSIGSGISVLICRRRGMRAVISRAAEAWGGPTSVARASSRLASVAERPQVQRPGESVRRRASASSVCTPRLVASSSCHSSTTTVSSVANTSAAVSSESRIESVSGVVTSPSGQAWRSCRRFAAEESPVRRSTRHARPAGVSRRVSGGRSAAAPASHSLSSGSGCSKARSVSVARALSGVIQRIRGPATGAACWRARLRASAPSQAARVLPVPVGACSRPLWPASSARHVSR